MTNRTNPVLSIAIFITGIVCFLGAVGTAEGLWDVPPHKMTHTPVAAIPVDEPINIESDGELAKGTSDVEVIQVPEQVIVIRASPAATVEPGAARRRRTPVSPVSPVSPVAERPLSSPTGLASRAALSYNPMARSHRARAPRLRFNTDVTSMPAGGIDRSPRETIVIE